MKHIYILTLFVLISTSLFSQKKIKVLFIGNSFTYVNNLPQTVAYVAKANGDTVVFDSSTPGGYTFQQHLADTTTLHKIAEGGWDYVVLQDQSEEPSFPPSQVQTDVYPYAMQLDSLIHLADSCTETVFYLTWGHQNGDPPNCAGYPQICTYSGMQDRLTQSYLEMAQMNHAIVSPVGEAWRVIFDQPHPYDMYLSDSTHPSIYGTYLAATVFYQILFQKSAINDTFVTAGIPDSDAVVLRHVAYNTVFDSLSKWMQYGQVPLASFTDSVSAAQVTFTSTSISGSSFTWDYGDGQTGSGSTASHTYDSSGTYHVTLTVYDKCRTSVYSDSVSVTVPIVHSGLSAINPSLAKIYPDPASSVIHVDFISTDVSGGYEINLVNELGQISAHQIDHASGTSIDVSTLADGIYIAVIKTASGEYRYRVSVVH